MDASPPPTCPPEAAPPAAAAAGQPVSSWISRHRPVLRYSAALLVFGGLANWHLTLRERALQTGTALASAQARYAAAEAQVRDAERVRPPLTALVAQPRRIEDERQLPDWTPALRALALATAPGVEFARVQAHGETANPGCLAMRLEGTTPNRAAADLFRKTLATNLQKHFPDRLVTARFDRLEEPKSGRGAAAQGSRPATFVVTATVAVARGRIAQAGGTAP